MKRLPLLLALVTLAGTSVDAGVRKDRHVVILGADGLKPDTIDRYLTSSKYRDLRRDGFLARMLGAGRGVMVPRKTIAIFPSYTWPAWGTIFTGHFPGQHGVMGQVWLLRDQRRYFYAYSNFTDGPRAYGWEFDVAAGRKIIDGAVGKIPTGAARKLARKLLKKLEEAIAGAATGFTLAKVVAPFKAVGHSMVTESLFVPTVYDHARRRGLRTHNIFNFYHHKSAPSGVPTGFTRPGKETLLRVGVADKLGGAISLAGRIKKALKILEPLGKALKFLKPITDPLKKMTSNELVRSVSPLMTRYTNKTRGHVYIDQVAVDHAVHIARKWQRLPHLLNLYQNAPDAVCHYVKGDLDDKQAVSLGFFDHNTRPFIDALARRKEWKKILFVLVSDHGHTALKKFYDARTTKKVLALGGVGEDHYVEAQNGAMTHIYLVSDKNQVRNLYPPLKRAAKVRPGSPLERPAGEALRIAGRIAAQSSKIPKGYALLMARDGAGRYRVFYARGRGKTFKSSTGSSLRAFARSQFNRSWTRFVSFQRRVENFGHPQRSGDIILVTSAGTSYDDLPSSHGGLQAGDSGFTLVFFGPGVDGVHRRKVTLRTAYQVDVAPTILRYLGIDAGTAMAGKTLFDENLSPIGASRSASGSRTSSRGAGFRSPSSGSR